MVELPRTPHWTKISPAGPHHLDLPQEKRFPTNPPPCNTNGFISGPSFPGTTNSVGSLHWPKARWIYPQYTPGVSSPSGRSLESSTEARPRTLQLLDPPPDNTTLGAPRGLRPTSVTRALILVTSSIVPESTLFPALSHLPLIFTTQNVHRVSYRGHHCESQAHTAVTDPRATLVLLLPTRGRVWTLMTSFPTRWRTLRQSTMTWRVPSDVMRDMSTRTSVCGATAVLVSSSDARGPVGFDTTGALRAASVSR